MQHGEAIPPLGAIYCPQVMVIRDSVTGLLSAAPFSVSVIAASLRCCAESEVLSNKEKQFLEDKVASVLNVAADNKVTLLVLGAWGCGAFGNSPLAVAGAFKRVLRTYQGLFTCVVFAILPGENLDAFITTFGEDVIVAP